jgi:hypothetical protein
MRSKVFPALLILLLVVSVHQVRAESGALPSMPDTKITVPWDWFITVLKELGDTPLPPPIPPPADVVIGRATYAMNLSSGRLESSVTIEVTTFGDGWHELFVAGRDTPLVSVTVDGNDAVTLVRPDGVWVALPAGGRRTVRAVVVCDAPETAGPHTVTISGPDAAVRGVDLIYPRGFADVGVGGVVISSAPGRISSVLSGGGGVTLSYTAAAAEGPTVPGKTASGPPEIIAEVLSVMDVQEEAVVFKARIACEVRSAPVRSFRVRLPKGFDLLDVAGDGIASWKTSEDHSELTVTVGYDVIGSYALLLTFEGPKIETADALPFPKVMPVGAERATGFLAVVSGGGFEVTEKTSEFLTARDPSELPEAILSLSALPPVLAYRFTDPGFSLSVAVGKGKDLSALSAYVDSANSVVLVTGDGKMVVRTNYFVRNRSLQFLRITLPAGSVFWSATVRGAPVRTAADREGVVMIPLPMGAASAAEPFVVSVVIFVPVPAMRWAGRFGLGLPSLDIPTGEVMATFYLPEDASYLSFGGDMEAIEYFTEVLAPDATESFMSDNLRLRKTVYERQNDLEKAINEQQQLPEKGDTGLPPAPEGFDLPLRGKEFRFVKLIAMGEKTSVRATYVDRRLLVVVILLAVVLAGAIILRYRRVMWNIVSGLRDAGKR